MNIFNAGKNVNKKLSKDERKLILSKQKKKIKEEYEKNSNLIRDKEDKIGINKYTELFQIFDRNQIYLANYGKKVVEINRIEEKKENINSKKNNIIFGRNEENEDELVDSAIKNAYAYKFIYKFPDKLNHIVGVKGGK